MKRHSPDLERQLRIKPEAQALLANDPVWRRIWDRLFQPIDEGDARINERLDRYTSDGRNAS